MSVLINPNAIPKEEFRTVCYSYFQILYNGYRNFPERCMTVQKLSLNQEVMASFQHLVKMSDAKIIDLLLLETNLKCDPMIIYEKVKTNQMLSPEEYDDLKQIAGFICFVINKFVSQFLNKYREEVAFENLVMN